MFEHNIKKWAPHTMTLALALLALMSSSLRADGNASDYDFIPPLVSTVGSGDKPNVLVILDNSNSMDESPIGLAVGSDNAGSKSEIARAAVRTIMTNQQNTIRMGLMTYKQTGVSAYHLHSAYYDSSFDPANYDAAYSGDRDSSTKRYRAPNPTNPGAFIYYNVTLPLYSGANLASGFCQSPTADFDNGAETYPAGPWDSYTCWQQKNNTSDVYPSGFATPYFSGAFSPTDSDIAQNILDFGQYLSWTYTGSTWYSNSSPGKGMLHVEIDDLDAAHMTALNNKLATSQFAVVTDTPVRNAGLTPLEGTLQSALDYFTSAGASSALDPSEYIGGTSVSLPPSNTCDDSDYVVLVTDGLPSVDELGNPVADTATAVAAVAAKANALRLAGVRVFVVGFGLPEYVDQTVLDQIATSGGTGEAFYAEDSATLDSALASVFSGIINRTSSATGAAVVSNNSRGTGAAYQALYTPETTDSLGNQVSWVGTLHGFFVDDLGYLREDTDGDAALDGYNVDRRLEFFYDELQGKTRVYRYSTSSATDPGVGTASAETVDIEDLSTIWNARDQLTAVSDVTTQRTYWDVASSGRYIVTTIDGSNLVNFEALSQTDLDALAAAEATAAANLTAAQSDLSSAEALISTMTSAAGLTPADYDTATLMAQALVDQRGLEVTAAQVAVSTATDAVAAAQASLDSANTTLTAAQAAEAVGLADLTAAQTNEATELSDMNAAQAAITTQQTELDNEVTDHITYQQNVIRESSDLSAYLDTSRSTQQALMTSTAAYDASRDVVIAAMVASGANPADPTVVSLQAVLDTEQSDFYSRVSSLETARNDLAAAETDVDNAHAALTTTIASYQGGSATLADLLASETTLTTANTALNTALSSYDTAFNTAWSGIVDVYWAHQNLYFALVTAGGVTTDPGVVTANTNVSTALTALNVDYSAYWNNDINVNATQTDLNTVQGNLATSLASVQSEQTDVVNAQSDYAQAVTDYNTAQTTTASAQTAYDALRVATATATTARDAEAAVLAAAQSDLATANANLATAQATLATAESAQTTLSDAIAGLGAAQIALANAQQAVSNAEYINYMDAGDLTNTEKYDIARWVRGEEVAGLRSRTYDIDGDGSTEVWRLGDIVHSTPKIVGQPNDKYDVVNLDPTYADFRNQYINRRQVVYVGGNDGMLHAFNGGFWDDTNKAFIADNGSDTAHPLGAELWSYIPQSMLPHLQFLADSGYSHQFFVDGAPQAYDVNIFPASDTHPGGWGTILVVTLRLGGGLFTVDADNDGTAEYELRPSIAIFDITNPEVPPSLITEFSHENLGYTTSLPAVVKARIPSVGASYATPQKNEWYLAFGSGPTVLDTATSDQRARFFLYDLVNRELVSGYDPYPFTVNNSFVGDVGVVDWGSDYVDDALYFGLNSGDAASPGGEIKRLRFATTGASMDNWISSASFSTIYNPRDSVIGAPSMKRDEDGRYWVYAGTGRLYEANDNVSTDDQWFFGMREEIDSDGEETLSTLGSGDLYDTSNVSVYTDGSITGAGAFTTFGDLLGEIESNYSGWRLGLTDDGTNPSGRNLNASATLRQILLFSEYVPSSDVCDPEGSSKLYALHYKTGTAFSDVILESNPADTNAEGVLSMSSVDLGRGLASAPTVISNSEGHRAFIQKSTGELTGIEVDVPIPPSMRQSWRQIIDFEF